ncbi:MAG TPA: hypothetical protein VFB21_24150 [Chthonomonadaceae bacterium]|nr:hypothetical protein [Chthonomonadaceae bacterium]
MARSIALFPHRAAHPAPQNPARLETPANPAAPPPSGVPRSLYGTVPVTQSPSFMTPFLDRDSCLQDKKARQFVPITRRGSGSLPETG